MYVWLNDSKTKHSNETPLHIVKLFKLVAKDFSKIGPNRVFFLDVGLHQLDVRAARTDIVSDRAHLLYLVAQHAVECDARLKQANLVAGEADLPAQVRGETRQLRVVRPNSQLCVLGRVLRALLSIGSSEHL